MLVKRKINKTLRLLIKSNKVKRNLNKSGWNKITTNFNIRGFLKERAIRKAEMEENSFYHD